MKYIVVTSINDITDAVKKFSKQDGWHVIIVGDVKSIEYTHENVTYLTIDTQAQLDFYSTTTTPINHYSRKNIGYLYAMRNKAEVIYDTDDDTFPYESWNFKEFTCGTSVNGSKFINPFKFFTEEKSWPRGLSLSYINENSTYIETADKVNIGVWQGIIDGDSDFDAIYRLTNNKHFNFNKNKDIAIGYNCYAPFNTQSTFWNRIFYSLMYIPITVDFRFTDILRGYIAQRIMWKYGYNIGFHSPNTYQIRNAHNYFNDFLGEIAMYTQVPIVIEKLDSVNFDGTSINDDLRIAYKSLCEINVVKKEELINLENWISDLQYIDCKSY